jgi:MinD-like ATPase involved in chromosome partitioning or flagellar assembly
MVNAPTSASQGEAPTVSFPTSEGTEIICVASGKGGTGKTSILTSLGYALQVSGHRVLFLDTDTATDGLSLFLLGPRGWEALEGLQDKDTFAGYIRSQPSDRSGQFRGKASPELMPQPFKVNRGRQDDHGQIYDVLVSGRSLYGDVNESSDAATHQISREAFRIAIQDLFDDIRGKKQWDYVLVDTRGGFAFHTTDVCALSDSFFLVTEPQFSSFYQDKNLIYRISAAGAEISRKPTLRGIVVNKATESAGGSTIHTLNLDQVEGSFRNALVEGFGIRYGDTYPIPLDIDAVESYKSHKIPYLAFPGSVFSYSTLVAFSGLLKTVTVRWPVPLVERWNALVDSISKAIKIQNDRVGKQLQEEKSQQEIAERLHKETELLTEKLKLGERVAADRERFYEEYRAEQTFAAERRRKGTLVQLLSVAVVTVGLMLLAALLFVQNSQSTLQLRLTEQQLDTARQATERAIKEAEASRQAAEVARQAAEAARQELEKLRSGSGEPRR